MSNLSRMQLTSLGRISGLQTPTSAEDTVMDKAAAEDQQNQFTSDGSNHEPQVPQAGFDDGSFQNCAWMFSDSSLNDLYTIPFMHPEMSMNDFY